MANIAEVEKDILRDLETLGPCSIEDMVDHLPGYSWNQVFSAVDRLSRNSKITLRHPSRFGYRISLADGHRPSAHVDDSSGGRHPSCSIMRA